MGAILVQHKFPLHSSACWNDVAYVINLIRNIFLKQIPLNNSRDSEEVKSISPPNLNRTLSGHLNYDSLGYNFDILVEYKTGKGKILIILERKLSSSFPQK